MFFPFLYLVQGLLLLCKALKGDFYNILLRNWSLSDFACRNTYVYQEHPLTISRGSDHIYLTEKDVTFKKSLGEEKCNLDRLLRWEKGGKQES